MIYATYNIYHNNIDVYTYTGYLLRIYCNKAEERLKTTPCSECALNALAIDKPLDIRNPSAYRWIYCILKGNMQMWVDTQNSLEFLKLYLIHSC